MAWRVASSLLTLRDQINAAWPNRNRASDGTIGDSSHVNRASDHNPWVRDGNMGVVTAMDITHDTRAGCDAGKLAEAIRTSRDKRIKYIIWNSRICSSSAINGQPEWAWRPYGGPNPHDKHVHLSVRESKAQYDSTAVWAIDATGVIQDPMGPEASSRPYLRRGSRAAAVWELQTLLNKHGHGIEVDGKFGEETETAVENFQTKFGLFSDGEVGSKTWAALLV